MQEKQDNNKGKKVALGLGALAAGIAAVPVIAFVNVVAGIVVLALPVAFVLMAS